MGLEDLKIFENERHNLICPFCGKDHLTVTLYSEVFIKYRVTCPRCHHFVYLSKGDAMREWTDYCIDIITSSCKYPPDMAATLKEEFKGVVNPLDVLYIMKKYQNILEVNAMAVNALNENENEEKEVDVVNHPSHYETGKYECIEVMVEAIGATKVMDFCLCNAFKYLYRCGRKNGVEDIKKARWYLNKYLELWEDFGNEDN